MDSQYQDRPKSAYPFHHQRDDVVRRQIVSFVKLMAESFRREAMNPSGIVENVVFGICVEDNTLGVDVRMDLFLHSQ